MIYSQKPNIVLEFARRNGKSFKLYDCASYQSYQSLSRPTSQALPSIMGTRLNNVDDRSLAGADLRKVVEDYDLCRVMMDDAKGKVWTDIYGPVISAMEVRREEDGKPVHKTNISIQGLGAFLESAQIFWHPHVSGRANLAGVGGYIRARGKIPRGRPDEVVRKLIEVFLLNDEYALRLADGRLLKDAVTLVFDSFKDSAATTGLKALGLEANLWKMCQRYQDAPWGEFFTQVDQDKPKNIAVYMRPTPFDFDAWETLAGTNGWGYEWSDTERMSAGEPIEPDTAGVSSMYLATGKAILSAFDQLSLLYDQSGGKIPIYDLKSFQKYGLRQLIQGTEYIQFYDAAAEKSSNLTVPDRFRHNTKLEKRSDLLYRRTLQLWQWFGYLFDKGSVTLRGRIGHSPTDGARLGAVITRKRDGYQFYVTDIAQNWAGVQGGGWQTTLTLTRGRDQAAYKKWWRESLTDHAVASLDEAVRFLGA